MVVVLLKASMLVFEFDESMRGVDEIELFRVRYAKEDLHTVNKHFDVLSKNTTYNSQNKES